MEEGLAELAALIAERFDNLHLLTPTEELQLAISRKGKASLRRSRKAAGDMREDDALTTAEPPTHDRAKQRPVDIAAPWLTALGVTDAQQRLVPAMARKWKQINKFVEVLGHAVESAPALAAETGRPLQVLDFGAGKGYLTFAAHAHLSRLLARPVQVTGVDLKEDMVALGNETALRLGLQHERSGLRFEVGDVSRYAARPIDIEVPSIS